MSRTGKRIIAVCLLAATAGILVYPPYHQEYRFFWKAGHLDWDRLALELCLLAVLGALAFTIASLLRGRKRQPREATQVQSETCTEAGPFPPESEKPRREPYPKLSEEQKDRIIPQILPKEDAPK
jgi:hypothetical protein